MVPFNNDYAERSKQEMRDAIADAVRVTGVASKLPGNPSRVPSQPVIRGPYKGKARPSTFLGRASMKSFVSKKSRKHK